MWHAEVRVQMGRRSSGRAGLLACCLTLCAACSSPSSARVLQESDLQLGSFEVHVTLDDSLRVCTTIAQRPLDCLSAERKPGEGILTARLDAVQGAPYVLRVLASPGAQFADLPGEHARLNVAMNTELVLALYDAAPACFHMTDASGENRTVTVAASTVDSGTGDTTAASAEPAC